MVYPIVVSASPPSWSRSSCGRSSRCSRRCSRAWARSCRCPPASSSRCPTGSGRLLSLHGPPGHRRRPSRSARYYATHGGRRVIDRMVLQLPVIGQLSQQDRGGTVLPNAVDPDFVGRADPRRPRDHRPYRRATPSSRMPSWWCARRLKAEPRWLCRCGRARCFPTMVVQMVGVGEQTGALDAMLGEDRRLLRRRSRPDRGQPADPDGTAHDHVPWRHHRRHRHQHVLAAVRNDQQALRLGRCFPGPSACRSPRIPCPRSIG